MAFHKHGMFSFHVTVQRMAVIGGESYVAEVTALRQHDWSGAAQRLEIPPVKEEYGETAPQAEARVTQAMRDWLSRAAGDVLSA